MTARKSERIMNLAICLLMARRFIDRHQIRDLVEGYAGLSDGAFDRTFERDKDELRAMGVPIETGSNSALFPDETGYRVRRGDFELPPIEFDAAETAVLGLASGVWDSATLGGATLAAIAKLRAAGIDPDAGRVSVFAPTMGAREPAFEPLWHTTLTRTPTAFAYRGVQRVVEPWTLTYRKGAWYLIGRDRTRGAGRAFKLSRIDDTPRAAGAPGSYDWPSQEVVDAHLATLEPHRRDSVALVAVRDGAAGELTREAERADVASPLAGYRVWRVPVSADGGSVGELAAFGPDVLVLEPADLRAAVVAHLSEGAATWR